MPRNQPKANQAQPTARGARPKTAAPRQARLRSRALLDIFIAVVDFTLAFIFLVSALDTGSLLQYGLSLAALLLGLRSAISAKAVLGKPREPRSD